MKKKYILFIIFFITQLFYTQQIKYINTENLNIRNGPGKNYSVVDTAPLGEKVIVLSENGNWSEIETDSGTKGYASTSFLSSNLPVKNNNKKNSSESWKILLFFAGLYILYKFFTTKRKSNYSLKSRSAGRITSTSSINESRATNNNKKYYCKFCATEKSDAHFLTSGKCSKSPNGYHQVYEGTTSDKYQCKFCGTEKQNLFFLTSNRCSKSPNGYHQAFEGGHRIKYICKYCSQEKQNLFFLTSNKCSKSPNGYHQPLL